ncbi:MAG: phosphotransacetylase family protein [Candidatus Hydrothermarchaeaceae archaeon]
MKPLYVVGTSGSGKTATCLGLIQKFREEGLKVSYFKPVGNVGDAEGKEDEDAKLMKHVLDMKAPIGKITPYTLTFDYLEKYPKEGAGRYLDTVVRCYEEVSEGSDLVVMEGTTNPQAMVSLGLGASDIATKLGAEILVVSMVKNDFRLDNLVMQNEYMKDRGAHIVGTVFNFVPPDITEKTLNTYVPILEDRGFRILGVVPESKDLTSPTVQEVHDILGGELLIGEDRMGLLVKTILIGAMNVDSALKYFKKSSEKAVITGGDRTDIALAALDTHTSALILTGDLHPDHRVLSKAKEKGVPTILVPHDTYTTVERLHDMSRKIKPEDERSLKLTRELVGEYIDWEEVLLNLKD